MQKRSTTLLMLTTTLLLLAILALVVPVIGQDDEGTINPRPMPITPGVPLSGETPFPRDQCFAPLPISIGQVIYLEVGVNIRNQPTTSGALVWNTVYDNRNEEGELVDFPLKPPATVVDGPVCTGGYNWWRVVGLGNPGWVAEGRPDIDGGYFIDVPVVENPECESFFENAVGKVATITLNARVRDEPDLEARTATVAPAGSAVRIIGGSECVGGVLWWLVQVEVVDFVYQGWMAEFANGIYFMVPEDAPSTEDGTLCTRPLQFVEGTRGFVNYPDGQSPKALRVAPDDDAPLLFNLVKEVPFVVEGGPVCSDNLNWWRIRVLTSRPVIGWMAEGSPGEGVGYWMTELDIETYAPPP